MLELALVDPERGIERPVVRRRRSTCLTAILRISSLYLLHRVRTPLELAETFFIVAMVATLLTMGAGVRLGIALGRKQPHPNDQVHA